MFKVAVGCRMFFPEFRLPSTQVIIDVHSHGSDVRGKGTDLYGSFCIQAYEAPTKELITAELTVGHCYVLEVLFFSVRACRPALDVCGDKELDGHDSLAQGANASVAGEDVVAQVGLFLAPEDGCFLVQVIELPVGFLLRRQPRDCRAGRGTPRPRRLARGLGLRIPARQRCVCARSAH